MKTTHVILIENLLAEIILCCVADHVAEPLESLFLYSNFETAPASWCCSRCPWRSRWRSPREAPPSQFINPNIGAPARRTAKGSVSRIKIVEVRVTHIASRFCSCT